LVLGLGNTIRGDDSVGLEAVRRLQTVPNLFPPDTVTWRELEESNINILDMLDGAEALVVVDSVQTKGGRPGEAHRLDVTDLLAASQNYSTHQMGLIKVLSMAQELDLPMPQRVAICAMEVATTDEFVLGLSPAVENGFAGFVQLITKEIQYQMGITH
jgi:hydrogenase maturation protease